MFEIVKFRKEHIKAMMGQKSNRGVDPWLENGHAQSMEDHKGSFTIMVKGKVACCGGLIEYWTDRGYLWCVLNEEFKGNFVPVFRGIQHFLNSLPCRRMEMAVPVDFEQGHRRAKLLGFNMETRCARKFFPDGQDGVIYAMVRG